MRTRNLVIAMALVVVGVAIGWISAPGNPAAAAGTLMGQDYAEIEQLYWRYNHGSDFRDAEVYLSAFADDAVFNLGQRRIAGRKELAAYRVERHAGQTGATGQRHWNNGWRITPTADGAEARVYWMLWDVTGEVPRHTASGYYDDEYAKTADGWRIKHRTIYFDRAG